MWTLYKREHIEGKPSHYALSVQCPKAHGRIIWNAAWSYDNRFFVTASRDKTVKLWTTDCSGKAVATLNFADSATAVALAPSPAFDETGTECYLLAVGLENGSILLFTLPTDTESLRSWISISSVSPKNYHSASVTSLDFRVIVSDEENVSARSLRNRFSDRIHHATSKTSENTVAAIEYQLASCSDDGSVRIHRISI